MTECYIDTGALLKLYVTETFSIATSDRIMAQAAKKLGMKVAPFFS
ncbi:MAG: hypothetical protein PHZ14_01130 [Sulfuricella sp.]|nr:hypothetical protein [Sulfuricella sp.]